MDLMQGTLDMLILRILVSGKRHGFDISKRIQLLSESSLQVGPGSMYPALHRLERRGLLKASKETGASGKMAKFYELTSMGREQVETERLQWQEFVSTINQILDQA